MAEGDTGMNALIGAIVGVVLAPILPFSTVVGGAVSGYLQGDDRQEGLRVGAFAGAIMLIPILLFLLLLGNVFFFAAAGGAFPSPSMFGLAGGFTIVIFIFAFFFGLVYVVGLAAVGGYVGNYVKTDTDVGN